MTDTPTPDPGPDPREGSRPPVARVKTGRHISIIWAVPVVAVLIAGWLGYQALTSEGPTISITFETAEGIDVGRTKVMNKNVPLGTVTSVELSPDLSHVIVHAKMNREAEPHLLEGTRFWVVRPRISAAGISGLTTLVSGAFIEMAVGKGEEAREFTGLEIPPLIEANVPGRRFTLKTGHLGSLTQGSPLYFKGIEVGQVMGYNLASDGRELSVFVYVRSPYDKLVHPATRFWNAGGIVFSTGPNGLKVSAESLQSVIAGGVAFDTPADRMEDESSPAEANFPLFDDETSARQAPYGEKVYYLINFPGSMRGLDVGAPVELRGIRVGRVSDMRLELDLKSNEPMVPVTVELEPERLAIVNAPPPQTPPPTGGDLQTRANIGLEQLIAKGMRARLQTGNLLTGQRVVTFDFIPTAPPAKEIYGGKYPELPAIASVDIDSLTSSAGAVLDKLSALPLPELIQDLRGTIQGLNGMITSPGTKQAMQSLNRSLDNLDRLTKTANTELGPLLSSLRQTSDNAQDALKAVGGMMGSDPRVSAQLPDTLRELKDAASSLKNLTDYLERHPESLLRGRSTP
ncbi:MAG TPA: MlaD family protein [Stellaceae bacterium]|nr:MlaD family protein [Stellaceae bacterium]